MHILALEKIDRFGGRAYNLGNGNGYSVLEVLEETKRVRGQEIPSKFAGRWAGDPAVLVASSEAVKRDLGWEPKHPQLSAIIESAWNWHRKHPLGYGE